MQPYPEQLEAVKVAAAKGQGAICMPTGFGKSICMALLIQELQVRTLVVVPNLTLKVQLTESFRKLFGSLDNITVENIDSGKLLAAKDYDCLIIDEAHHAAATTYRRLNMKAWGGIFYRFFFTATPYRARDEEQILMESITGPVIYRVSYEQALSRGAIVPVEAYYIDLPVTQMKGNPNSWPAVYSELVVNNVVRNSIICNLISSLGSSSTLTLVKEIRHGEILAEITGQPFANGAADNCRQLILEFILGENTSLIGTTGVIGEGLDLKPCEYVLLAAGGKSKTQMMQQIGRCLRLYPGKETGKVILFRDTSNKYLLNHFKAQVKSLRDEYGVAPLKLEV